MSVGLRRTALIATLSALAGCGGGSQSPFAQSSQYAAKCASPRSGIDPGTGKSFRDVQGTIADEKQWLRSWTYELYLWYLEVPDYNPAPYPTPLAFFDALKTPAKRGDKAKDSFHFTTALRIGKSFHSPECSPGTECSGLCFRHRRRARWLPRTTSPAHPRRARASAAVRRYWWWMGKVSWTATRTNSM